MSDLPLRLILFVAGSEPNSLLARKHLDVICREDLGGDFELQIVDILTDAAPALEHGVVVTPSLIATGRGAKVMIAGNLNNRDKVRMALDLPACAL